MVASRISWLLTAFALCSRATRVVRMSDQLSCYEQGDCGLKRYRALDSLEQLNIGDFG